MPGVVETVGDTDQHDQTLNEIVDRGCHVAADDDVDTCENCHRDHADGVVNIEGHTEQSGKTVVQGCGVRDHEDESDNGSRDLEILAAETLSEEFGHCSGIQMLRHDPCASAEDPPCQEGADQRVADSGPCGGDAVFPTELTCVPDEDPAYPTKTTAEK